jgi:hypothetical protein
MFLYWFLGSIATVIFGVVLTLTCFILIPRFVPQLEAGKMPLPILFYVGGALLSFFGLLGAICAVVLRVFGYLS